MKTKIALFLLTILVSMSLPACGSSQAEVATQPTVEVSQKLPTLTAQPPTFMPVPTNTPLPSSTSTAQPTDTPAPTATPDVMLGWKKFEAPGIELWLPDSYEGGDLENDLEVIVSKLKSLGLEFAQVAMTIEANPTAFVLWAFDTHIGSTGYLTNVNVIKEQVLSAVTIDLYLQAMEQQLPSYFTIVERDEGNLEGYESARLVIEAEISGSEARELMYVIKDSNTIWAITFATSMDEFELRLPDFEQSVQTFTTQPE